MQRPTSAACWVCGSRRPLRSDFHFRNEPICMRCWKRPTESWCPDARSASALAAALDLPASSSVGARAGLVQQAALRHNVRAFIDAPDTAAARGDGRPFDWWLPGIADRAHTSLRLLDRQSRTGKERYR